MLACRASVWLCVVKELIQCVVSSTNPVILCVTDNVCLGSLKWAPSLNCCMHSIRMVDIITHIAAEPLPPWPGPCNIRDGVLWYCVSDGPYCVSI